MLSFYIARRACQVNAVGILQRASQRLYSTQHEKDLVIIGGGPGGYVAAIKASQLGMNVACVEGRGTLGGTCLNVGCIPSKALLHSSHMFHEAQHKFGKHGVMVGDLKLDLEAMMKQKDDAVKGLTSGIEGLFKKNKTEYVKGWGKITGANSVDVAQQDGSVRTLTASNIVIATGSEVTPLPSVPIDEERIVSSTGALKLKKVPEHMAIIGGGIIGLEMGSVWSRLGAKVTVIEFLDNIVPVMDGEVRRVFQRTLGKQGLNFELSTKVTGAEVSGEQVTLTMEPAKGGESKSLTVDNVLVAVGRRPYLEGLGLEDLGIKTDKGRVVVDNKFKTNIPSVHAIGDAIAGPMLAHKAEEDGIACVEMIANRGGHVNYDTVPSIVYTWPEVAWVGKTEEECKAAGIDYVTGKFNFMANSRARTVMDSDGVVKFVSEKGTDKVLGCHIMGPSAGELIQEVVLGLEYGASTEDIARTCHGHPTMSEAVKEAALATFSKPIHS